MTRLIESVPVIDFLKLRGSFGTTGNAGIGNFDWAGYGDSLETMMEILERSFSSFK